MSLGSCSCESLNGRPLTGDVTGATYPGPAMEKSRVDFYSGRHQSYERHTRSDIVGFMMSYGC